MRARAAQLIELIQYDGTNSVEIGDIAAAQMPSYDVAVSTVSGVSMTLTVTQDSSPVFDPIVVPLGDWYNISGVGSTSDAALRSSYLVVPSSDA